MVEMVRHDARAMEAWLPMTRGVRAKPGCKIELFAGDKNGEAVAQRADDPFYAHLRLSDKDGTERVMTFQDALDANWLKNGRSFDLPSFQQDRPKEHAPTAAIRFLLLTDAVLGVQTARPDGTAVSSGEIGMKDAATAVAELHLVGGRTHRLVLDQATAWTYLERVW